MSNSHKKNLTLPCRLPAGRQGRQAAWQGFSLVELLIVVAIIVTISGLGLFVGLDFYKTYALNSERDVMIGILMKARNKAANNFNQSAHGMFINSNGYTVFQGPSYASRNGAYDEFVARNNSVTESGLNEIVFEQLIPQSRTSP